MSDNRNWNSNQTKPSMIDGLNNASFMYYRNKLYRLVKSIFEFDNFPDTWDIDYFRDRLFFGGYMAIVEHGGVNYCLDCGFTGYNVYNKATGVSIANPVIGNFYRTLDKDAALVYMEYSLGHYRSLQDLITRYATWLALADGTLCSTLINSRVSSVFYTNNHAETQAVKKLYDNITSGKPYSVVENKKGKKLDKENDFLNVKNTYIGNDVLDTKRTIINEFLTEIGIKNANTDKKERLNGDEVNSNNQECVIGVMLWQETLNECFDKAKQVFPYLDIKCNLRIDNIEQAAQEVIDDGNTDRDV